MGLIEENAMDGQSIMVDKLPPKQRLKRTLRIAADERLPNGRFKPGLKNRLIWRSKSKLRKAVDQYFDWTLTNNKIPTLAGLAVSLGVSRKTLYNYQGQYPEVMSWAKTRIEESLEQRLVSGKGGSVVGIKYALSNGFGWSEHAELSTQNKSVTLSGFRLIPPDQQEDDK